MANSFSTKQPSEAFAVSFDFTARLGAETITSAVISAVDTSTLEDVSATILDVTKQTITGALVYGYTRAGTGGHNYLINCRIVGSLGSLYELEGILPVEETPIDTGEAGTGPCLSDLLAAIQGVIQDPVYNDVVLTDRINDAISAIAGGIRMPDSEVSPPLPDLYKSDTVITTTLAYASLPADYQRNVFNVFDGAWNKINPPRGGGYYSFNLFLKQSSNMSLAETGSVYRVCVKGRKLYYQGIPAAPANIGIHYYRKPTPLTLGTDEPDCLPEHLQKKLIKHYVCKEIFGESIEDGQDNSGIGTKYHTGKFFEAMADLIDFIGIDSEPQYYGSGGFEDRGACDG